MLDRGAIEADICTVLVYQCRVKEEILTKTLKPSQSPKNLVVFIFYPYQGSGTINPAN